jgi:hypothetical protein
MKAIKQHMQRMGCILIYISLWLKYYNPGDMANEKKLNICQQIRYEICNNAKIQNNIQKEI